jgi:hypothetical protein
MAKTHGGKGSDPRPISVSQQQFADNWDRIFKDKKTKKPNEKQTTPVDILPTLKSGDSYC